MGLSFISSSSYDTASSTSLPNPKPNNYEIIRSKKINKCIVIEIKYHDCINYEGRKILVYKCRLEDLISQKSIDPHFSDSKDYISPIARFEPTESGWKNACKFSNL